MYTGLQQTFFRGKGDVKVENVDKKHAQFSVDQQNWVRQTSLHFFSSADKFKKMPTKKFIGGVSPFASALYV